MNERNDDRLDMVETVCVDNPPENIDRMVNMAVRLVDAETGLITALDDRYQSFMAQCGADYDQMDKNQSVCQFALENTDGSVLVIPDMTRDHRTESLDLVTEDGYQSYMGAPIVIDGHVLGTLCVLDKRPRNFLERTEHDLETLAREVAERLKQDRTKKQLVHQKSIFQDMTQTMDDLFWMTDPSFSETLFVNDAAQELLNVTEYELYEDPMNFINSIHPDDQERVISTLDSLKNGTRTWMTARVQFEDHTKTLRFTSAPVRNNDGEVIRLTGIITDVTEYHDLQDELRKEKKKFKQFADAINEVFWIRKPDKKGMDYCSPAIETIWGYTQAELIEDHDRWVEALHPDDRERVLRAAQNDQVTGDYDIEYRIYDTDGELHWIHDKAFPIRENGEVQKILGVAEDITNRKKRNQELREKEKLADIGEMSAMIMHEINNPNGYIKGNLDFLKKVINRLEEAYENKDTDKVQNYIDELDGVLGSMYKGTNRIESITQDVKTFAREAHKRRDGQTNRIEVQALCDAARTIDDRFDNPDGLTFHCPCGSGDSAVPLNEDEFISVLTNLIENALDATDPDNRQIDVTITVNSHLELTVKDNGEGIDPDMQETLFEPFETDKTTQSGTGLGLALIKSIVDRTDGSIEVESEPGSGTTFKLILPLVSDKDTPPPSD